VTKAIYFIKPQRGDELVRGFFVASDSEANAAAAALEVLARIDSDNPPTLGESPDGDYVTILGRTRYVIGVELTDLVGTAPVTPAWAGY
jgi:hypothetical protein